MRVHDAVTSLRFVLRRERGRPAALRRSGKPRAPGHRELARAALRLALLGGHLEQRARVAAGRPGALASSGLAFHVGLAFWRPGKSGPKLITPWRGPEKSAEGYQAIRKVNGTASDHDDRVPPCGARGPRAGVRAARRARASFGLRHQEQQAAGGLGVEEQRLRALIRAPAIRDPGLELARLALSPPAGSAGELSAPGSRGSASSASSSVRLLSRAIASRGPEAEAGDVGGRADAVRERALRRHRG